MPRTTFPTLAAACALGFAATSTISLATEPHQERPISAPTATAPKLGGIAAESDKKEPNIFDKIWDWPTLYKNDESPFLNEFRIVGRLHLDQYDIDSNLGHDQDWIVRRFRLGGKAEFFDRRLTAHVEFDIDPQNKDNTYRRITDAYLAWKFSNAVRLTVGKQSVKFTLDGSISSNELLTIDRSNLANNLWFTEEYIPGVSLSGKYGQWVYNTGIYSGGSASPEFGNFDAGWFGLISVGYDFGKQLGVKKALLRADYVYNQRDLESTFTRPFENVASVVFALDAGRWGFSTDVSGGTGFGTQGNVLGVEVLPWYNITDNFQVVGRYTYLKGDKPGSIRFARYDSFITSARGDEYNEVYAGLNYYIYGHKLKVQTGLSYETMHGLTNAVGHYAAWQWTTALRISW